jgi:predicted membrane channel-forming protein YqfA (hemolysin III family)
MKTVQHQYGYGIMITLIAIVVMLFDMNWESFIGVLIFTGFYFVIQLLSAILNRLNQIYHGDKTRKKDL